MKHKLVTIGLSLAFLASTAAPMSALALSNTAHRAVAKKAIVMKKKVVKKMVKKAMVKQPVKKMENKKAAASAKPAPAPVAEAPLPALPVGVSKHDADFPLACGGYRQTLVASDYTTPYPEGGNMADHKRRNCVGRLILAFEYDWNDNRSSEYPEKELIKLFGARPKFIEQTSAGTSLVGYYFNGNAILGKYGDAFSGTPPCYRFDFKDQRKSEAKNWKFGNLENADPSYCGK